MAFNSILTELRTIFGKRLIANLDKPTGAGFIEVNHGNRTLPSHHAEGRVFEKECLADDIASALQLELNLYYPGYLIRSH